jgi:hypothetical protein
MFLLRRVFVCLAAPLCCAGAAHAQLLWDAGLNNFQEGADLTRNAQAEDFRMPCFGTVTGAKFWTIRTIPDGVCDWRIYERDLTTGAPGVLRGSGTASLTSIFLGHTPITMQQEYSHTFSIPPLELEAGDYYLAIHMGSTCNVFRSVNWEQSQAHFGGGARPQPFCTGAFGNFTIVHHAFQIMGFHPPPPCSGDADQNGEVNFGDITTVLKNWAIVCPG